MLRLSTRGEYGVRAIYEIAKNYHNAPMTIREIAERQNLSISYLEQILNRLRREGLIKSQRGPGGGYVLSREPEDITIGRILKALEGPVAIAQCLDPKKKGCSQIERCVSKPLWKSLGERVERFLETISLSDLLKENSKIRR